jgi:hypothetical protein
MKSDLCRPDCVSSSVLSSDDSSKLISLLALAAGALAMPQTSKADVVFTDLGANFVTVGPSGTNSFLIDNLPGTARIAFESHATASGGRLVSAAQKSGYVRFKTHSSFVVMAGQNATWNQIGTQVQAVVSQNGNVGLVNNAGHFPNSFVHLYLAFKFRDSTQVTPNDRYGWIDLSLSNPGGGVGPDVTIFSYAFETTGATLAMGAIPEPAPVTLLALGALTLGATGLRSWRRKRAQANAS